MRHWFWLLGLPFLLFSETPPLPFAPLIPLEPQFPLELTQTNEQLLINNPQRLEETKQFIQNDLERHSFPWLTIVALLGCGGIGWAMYLTRDLWPKRTPKPTAALSPKQQFDQALLALQKRRLLKQGEFQMLYDELASILLSALQFRFGWKTKEMTTVEIERAFSSPSQLSELQKQALSFLTEIDQVKFADKKPSRVETEQFYQNIQRFIQELFSPK